MIATMSKLDEARQQAVDALLDAYGRTQATPDGMYCRIGRIDRAYNIAAGKGNPDKAMATIAAMVAEAEQAFAQAEKTTATYARLSKREGKGDTVEPPTCDCPSCRRVPMFGGKP